MSATTAKEWVYDLAEGSRAMRDLLGGTGRGTAGSPFRVPVVRIAAAQAAVWEQAEDARRA